MKIIELDQVSKYEDYKKLIFRRDKIKKDAFRYQELYYRTFGDLIRESFQIKVNCIRLKKQITYCQMCVNQDKKIFQNDLDTQMELIMEEYNQELQNLVDHIDNSKKAISISSQDVIEIKKIYRRIAKLIHPDIKPDLFQKAEIQDLWNRVQIAYTCNDLKELQNLEVLVNTVSMDENSDVEIPDLDERIESLNNEIYQILNTFPYQYKFILESEDEIQSHIDDLKDEIQEYKMYQEQLEHIYSLFEIHQTLN